MDYGKIKMVGGADSLLDGLQTESRQRRKTLKRLAQPGAAARPPRNDLSPKLEFGVRSLATLSLPKRNVRALDSAHVREIASSINDFGFTVPVLIDQHANIIAGVVRAEAARMVGLTHVPCIIASHLTKSELRMLRIRLNRTQENGQWSIPDLKLELEDLIIENEVPLDYSGLTFAELDHILLDADVETLEQGPLSPEPGVAAIARAGDVFVLGAHRIACGDATNPEIFLGLFHRDETARFILTDEPYDVPIAGHVTSGSHREFAMASGEMSAEEFLSFNLAWMKASLAHLADGGLFGTFIDWRGWSTVQAAATQLELSPINLIVWAKTNAGMGSLYRSQHELFPLFKKGDALHLNNVDLGKKGRWRSNLWTYPGASSLGSDARKGLQDHPTVKPCAMLADALLDVTNRGDIVLDPFLGSGSTLIAAERTGRRCRGLEIDPLYVDVIIQRYERETGREAVLEATGETFDELAVRRRGEQTANDADADNATAA